MWHFGFSKLIEVEIFSVEFWEIPWGEGSASACKKKGPEIILLARKLPKGLWRRKKKPPEAWKDQKARFSNFYDTHNCELCHLSVTIIQGLHSKQILWMNKGVHLIQTCMNWFHTLYVPLKKHYFIWHITFETTFRYVSLFLPFIKKIQIKL